MMHIYEHKTTMVASLGSASTISLDVRGGLMQQLLVRANSTGTVFRVNLTDEDGVVRRNYDFVEGELNDVGSRFPMVGNYTVQVTNATSADTFTVRLAVQE